MFKERTLREKPRRFASNVTIQKLIEGTEFAEVSDYVTYVLNEVLEENQDKVESHRKKGTVRSP